MNIAIVANIPDNFGAFSISGIVNTQIRLLADKHRVTLFVPENYEGVFTQNITIKKVFPVYNLKACDSLSSITDEHVNIANRIAEIMFARLNNFDVIFCHALISSTGNVPYALAIESASKLIKSATWYHWIHSLTRTPRDWYPLSRYTGQHFLVYPTFSDVAAVAEVHETSVSNVVTIPHIRDLKHVGRLSRQTLDFLDFYPHLLTADIVQVYPASTDRFDSKGVRDVIALFSLMKEYGKSVCLVIANQFSDRREQRVVDPIKYLEKVGSRMGLSLYRDLIFTSELFNGKYTKGLPERMLYDLMSLSNLFICPSRSESFCLALIEACLCGVVFPVLNSAVPVMREVTQGRGLLFNFGNLVSPASHEDERKRFVKLVRDIMTGMEEDNSIALKTFVRQSYSQDVVYNRYYSQILKGIEWGNTQEDM
jgi:glycosyltransferase involved in cell wall biosynthesis